MLYTWTSESTFESNWKKVMNILHYFLLQIVKSELSFTDLFTSVQHLPVTYFALKPLADIDASVRMRRNTWFPELRYTLGLGKFVPQCFTTSVEFWVGPSYSFYWKKIMKWLLIWIRRLFLNLFFAFFSRDRYNLNQCSVYASNVRWPKCSMRMLFSFFNHIG